LGDSHLAWLSDIERTCSAAAATADLHGAAQYFPLFSIPYETTPPRGHRAPAKRNLRKSQAFTCEKKFAESCIFCRFERSCGIPIAYLLQSESGHILFPKSEAQLG
jgi:hypothetical protein